MATTDVLSVVFNAVTNIDDAVRGFQKLQQSIQKANGVMRKHSKLVTSLNRQYNGLNKHIETASQGMTQFNNTVDGLKQKGSILKDFQARMLAIGLSALFFGMFIRRFLGGIARSAVNAYMEIQGRHGEFTIAVNRLAGAWEFLKFSIMDALQEAGVLDWIIDKLIALVDWFSELSPTTQKWIGILVIVGLVASFLLFIFGQFMLGIVGITKVWGAFAVGSKAAILGTAGYLALATAAALLLVGSFVLAHKLMEKIGPSWEGYLTSFGTLVAGLAVGFKLLGFAILKSLGPIAVLAAFVSLLFLARELTDNWKDAFILAGLSIVRALQHIFTFIVSSMNPVIALIDAVIASSNAVLGTNFERVGPKVSKMVDKMIGGEAIQRELESMISLDKIGANPSSAAQFTETEQDRINKWQSGESSSETVITNDFHIDLGGVNTSEELDTKLRDMMQQIEEQQKKLLANSPDGSW